MQDVASALQGVIFGPGTLGPGTPCTAVAQPDLLSLVRISQPQVVLPAGYSQAQDILDSRPPALPAKHLVQPFTAGRATSWNARKPRTS